jgi:hypothetical protein
VDQQTLINLLTWGVVTLGSGLVFSLIWFARRMIAQMDRIESAFQEQMHDLDTRVHLLEAWREMGGTTRGPYGAGTK